MKWWGLCLLMLTGCVHLDPEKSELWNANYAASASRTPVQASDVTATNAHEIGQKLWDEIDADELKSQKR